MLGSRLVNLIESNSDVLAQGLIEKFAKSSKCSGMSKVPREELEQRTREIFHNLSDWLLDKTETDIEARYTELGLRRSAQGVPLSHLLWSIVTTKEHLQSFLRREGYVDRPVELFGELELFQLLGQFFDRAIYYSTVGYERARTDKKAA